MSKGETLIIKELVGQNELLIRLKELGFLPGVSIRYLGSAPFGEPLMFEVKGAVVALRKVEVKCLGL